jgi:uncharacterized membrane protein (DUF373 family)
MFERCIVFTVLFLMMMAVLAATVELAIILAQQLLRPPLLLLNFEESLEVFGFFLMVLIGLELLETIKAYLKEDKMHVEVVFLVAMVAISRKVIILDLDELTEPKLFGIAAIIVSLSVGYFLIMRTITCFQGDGSNAGTEGP